VCEQFDNITVYSKLKKIYVYSKMVKLNQINNSYSKTQKKRISKSVDDNKSDQTVMNNQSNLNQDVI
jgi:hypothetical protein